MESFETNYKPSQPEASSAIRGHIITASSNLLQAQILLLRMFREQKTSMPSDLLESRIKGIRPILDRLLELKALVDFDMSDDKPMSSIVPGVLAQMAAERSAEGPR